MGDKAAKAGLLMNIGTGLSIVAVVCFLAGSVTGFAAAVWCVQRGFVKVITKEGDSARLSQRSKN